MHADLVTEAIRLTRLLLSATPTDPETTALLALMLVTDARTAARSDADGSLIALPDQDRGLWDEERLREGRGLAAAAIATGPASPLVIQAAIASVHAAARRPEETDWRQILALYDALVRLDAGPGARLGRVVAVGMTNGPLAGLAELEPDARLARDHRIPAVKAALLERAGALEAARAAYEEARDRTGNQAERAWLAARAQRLPGARRLDEPTGKKDGTR